MRPFNTLTGFLSSKSSNPSVNDTVEFQGYDAIGDGGKGTWQHNGLTGTASQTPAQLGGALLNDGNGNQWALVPIAGAISAESLGVHNTGNDNDVFKAIIGSSSNITTVNFAPGNWDIFGDSVTVTQIFTSKKFIGSEGTTITFTNPDSTFRVMLKLSSDNVTFEGFKFIGVGNGGSFAFFQPVSDDFTLEKNEVDGGITGAIGAPSHIAYMLSMPGSGDIQRIKVRDNFIHNVSYSVLMANSSTMKIRNQQWTGNTFKNNYVADLSFNAPNADVSGLLLSGNRFSDSLKPNFTGAHYIGLASVSDVRITDNYFFGEIDNPVHIEENSNNLVIDSNVFDVSPLGSFGAISLQDNDIEGSPHRPDNVVISNNVIKKSGTQKEANSVGINLLLDGTGTQPASNVMISNNVVVGFETGYISTGSPNDSIVVIGNLADECGIGYIAKDKTSGMKNNVSSRCGVGVDVALGGDFDGHTFMECTTVSTTSGGILQLINPTYEFELFTTPGGSSVFKPVITEDSNTRVEGTMSVNVSTSSNADHSATIKTVSFDGAITTISSLQLVSGGGASSNISVNSGSISASIFTAAARTDCRLTCKLNGFVLIK